MQLFDQLKSLATQNGQGTGYNVIKEGVDDIETAFAKKMNKYQGFQKFAKEVQKDEKFSKSSKLL